MHRTPTEFGVAMASATGDCKVSIATDSFDLPLPAEALLYHFFKKGDIQRPLLSVGKACNDSCDVHFHQTHCDINNNGERLLTGFCGPWTGLYLLPTIRNNPSENSTIICKSKELTKMSENKQFAKAGTNESDL